MAETAWLRAAPTKLTETDSPNPSHNPLLVPSPHATSATEPPSDTFVPSTGFRSATSTCTAVRPEHRSARDQKDPNAKLRGRALPTVVVKHHMGKNSSSRIIEQAIWPFPHTFSFWGEDLYSTMWYAVAGSILTIARSCNEGLVHENKSRASYRKLHVYLISENSSPLIPSLGRLKLGPR